MKQTSLRNSKMNLSQYQNSLPGKLSDSGQFIPDLNTNQFRFSIIGNLKRAKR